MQQPKQLELPGLNLTEAQVDRLLLLRPALRPNRAQQMLLTVSGLLLLALFLFPPYMTPVDGREQLLGFYSLFGSNAQAALGAGSAPVFLHGKLLGLLVLQVVAVTGLLFGALSLTREDWAATITRYLHDMASTNTAEDFLETRQTAERNETALPMKPTAPDWDLRRVPVEEVTGQERAYQLERRIIGHAAELVSKGRSEEAEALLRRSLKQASFLEGPEAPFVAELAFRLANLLRDRKAFDEAEDFYLQSIEVYERTLGEESPSLASVLLSYARLLRDRGLHRPADQLERDAKRIRNLPFTQGTVPVVGDSPVEASALIQPAPKTAQAELLFLE
ncbi:tetratricopeptide repeat protein [bacterium]|nr:tetratricopeptide repeat protein [bacterium]